MTRHDQGGADRPRCLTQVYNSRTRRWQRCGNRALLFDPNCHLHLEQQRVAS